MTAPDAPSPLRNPRLLTAIFGCIISVPWLAVLYRPVGGGLDASRFPIGHDFINVWAAPQLAFSGRIATLFDLPGYHRAIGELFGRRIPFHNWSYPLYDLLLYWPFSQLPYFWSLAVWTIVFFLIFAAVTLSEIDGKYRLKALILLFLAPACLINTVSGQNGFITGALLIGGVLLIDRRPVLSGLLFGLLTYKPHLGIVLPFALLMLRAWTVIGVAAITTAVLVGSSIAVFGIEPWRQYFEIVVPAQISIFNQVSEIPMLMSITAAARAVELSFPMSFALQWIVAIPVVVAASWAVFRTRDPRMRATVLVGAALLVTPYSFNYDWAALAAVLTWKLFSPGVLTTSTGQRILLMLAWVVPILMMYLNLFTRDIGFGATAIIISPIILLIIFALDVRVAVTAKST